MNKLNYGSFDSDNTDIAFSATNGYSDPSSELDTRKQLSYPLKEIKTFVNNTVSVDSDDNAVQLVVTSEGLKYKSAPTDTPTSVPSGLPSGGTTNQVLQKNSNTDFDFRWGTIPAIYSGTTEPSASLGNDGDIYILYSE